MRAGVVGTCDAQIWEDTQELRLVVDWYELLWSLATTMTVKVVVGLLMVEALKASPLPMPMPQLIVKSQSNLFREQPGRQIDLSQVLPTKELFWLNLEEVSGWCGMMDFSCSESRTRKELKGDPLSKKKCINNFLKPLIVGAYWWNTQMKKKIQGRHNGSDFLAQLCGQNAKVAEIEQILMGGRLHFPEQLMRWFAA